MSPPCPSPAPAKRTHLPENRGFFAPVFVFLPRPTARRGSLPPLPASYLPVMKRRGRTLMWTQVTRQIQTKQKRNLENRAGETEQLARSEVELAERLRRWESRQLRRTRKVRADRRGSDKSGRKKDRGKQRKRDKRKVETYNFSLALCDPRVLIQYREDLAKDPIKASPLLVSLRLGWQTKDHCCCGVYKNQVGTISC